MVLEFRVPKKRETSAQSEFERLLQRWSSSRSRSNLQILPKPASKHDVKNPAA